MHHRYQQHGFSLIELMVVTAILVIIASIAIPAYNGYISTSRQAEGAKEIAAIQLAQEEFYLENNTYFGPTAGAGAAASEELYDGLAQLWEPGKWDTGLTNTANFQAMNFYYEIALCPGKADVSTCYVVNATGQNDVDAAIVLSQSKGN